MSVRWLFLRLVQPSEGWLYSPTASPRRPASRCRRPWQTFRLRSSACIAELKAKAARRLRRAAPLYEEKQQELADQLKGFTSVQ